MGKLGNGGNGKWFPYRGILWMPNSWGIMPMAPVRTEGSASPAVGEIFPIIRGAAPQMWSLIDNNPPPTLLSLIKANNWSLHLFNCRLLLLQLTIYIGFLKSFPRIMLKIYTIISKRIPMQWTSQRLWVRAISKIEQSSNCPLDLPD